MQSQVFVLSRSPVEGFFCRKRTYPDPKPGWKGGKGKTQREIEAGGLQVDWEIITGAKPPAPAFEPDPEQ